MITRIVKLEFQDDKIDEFLSFFDSIKQVVNSFPGCEGMMLYVDINDPTIVITYSYWQEQSNLDDYRNSSQFGSIWPKIKPWFSEKPQAWTLNAYFDGLKEKSNANS